MQYLIILALTIIIFGLYMINVRFFILSIIILYPIVAQMVSLNFQIFGKLINVSMAFGTLIFIVCFIETVKQLILDSHRENRRFTVYSLLFLSSCLLSLVFSVNRLNSIESIVKVSTWVLLMGVARRNFRSVSDLILIGGFCVVASLVIVVSYLLSRLGLYGYFSHSYETYGMIISVGAFYNSVSLAYPLAFCVPAILSLYYLDRHSFLSITQIVLNVLVILLSYVRAPILVLVFGYLGLTYHLQLFRIRRAVLQLIIGFVLITTLFMVFRLLQPALATNRWMELKEQYSKGDYERLGSGRVGLAMNAVEFQLNKQSLTGHIFGLGLGNSASINNYGKIVHNSLLEVWLGCGIVGLLFYTTFLFRIWKDLVLTIRAATDQKVKVLGCLGIMSFILYLSANFDVILFAVFPMSMIAIHVGATMGLGENKSW